MTCFFFSNIGKQSLLNRTLFLPRQGAGGFYPPVFKNYDKRTLVVMYIYWNECTAALVTSSCDKTMKQGSDCFCFVINIFYAVVAATWLWVGVTSSSTALTYFDGIHFCSSWVSTWECFWNKTQIWDSAQAIHSRLVSKLGQRVVSRLFSCNMTVSHSRRLRPTVFTCCWW